MVVLLLPDPFRGMGVQRKSTEAQQLDHAQRFGIEVKKGRSSSKDGVRTGSDAGQFRRGELDLTDDVRRRCENISPSAPTSRRLIVVVHSLLLFLVVVDRKWQNNFPEGFDHPVIPNHIVIVNLIVYLFRY